ncbi:MAG TPA: hypothetical protein VIY48_19255 [Candidatus Paceibacterota bacterium]
MTDPTATSAREATIEFTGGRVIKVFYEFQGPWMEDVFRLDEYAKGLSQILLDGITEDVGKQNQP